MSDEIPTDICLARDRDTLYKAPPPDSSYYTGAAARRFRYEFGQASTKPLSTTVQLGSDALTEFPVGSAYRVSGIWVSERREKIGDGVMGMGPSTVALVNAKLGLQTTQILFDVFDGTVSFGDWTNAAPAFTFVDVVVVNPQQPRWTVAIDDVGSALIDSAALMITMPKPKVDAFFRKIDPAFWSVVLDESQDPPRLFFVIDCDATTERFPDAYFDIKISGKDFGMPVDSLVGRPLPRSVKESTSEVGNWCLAYLQPPSYVQTTGLEVDAVLG